MRRRVKRAIHQKHFTQKHLHFFTVDTYHIWWTENYPLLCLYVYVGHSTMKDTELKHIEGSENLVQDNILWRVADRKKGVLFSVLYLKVVSIYYFHLASKKYTEICHNLQTWLNSPRGRFITRCLFMPRRAGLMKRLPKIPVLIFS